MTLSETQTVLLSSAASRPDGAVLPAPASLKAKGGALSRSLGALLKRGLVEECPTTTEDGIWRRDEDCPVGLAITPSGLAALGVDPSKGSAAPTTEVEPTTAAAPARPGGKLGMLVQMMSTGDGAALAELSESVGWQPHTTRAALTRLRQRGFDVRLVAEGGRKVYRLGVAA